VAVNPTIRDRGTGTTAAGRGKSGRFAVLGQGAHLLQAATPLQGFDV